jgi:hypothetical protein
MSRRAVSAAWRGGGVVALILFMQTVCQFFGINFVFQKVCQVAGVKLIDIV